MGTFLSLFYNKHCSSFAGHSPVVYVLGVVPEKSFKQINNINY